MDMLTAEQLRAARALLGWTRDDLAAKSGLAAVTVKGFEHLGADSKVSTVQKMRRALEAAGIRFIDEDADGGVRQIALRRPVTRRWRREAEAMMREQLN